MEFLLPASSPNCHLAGTGFAFFLPPHKLAGNVISCPNRAAAYQPRAKPWEPHHAFPTGKVNGWIIPQRPPQPVNGLAGFRRCCWRVSGWPSPPPVDSIGETTQGFAAGLVCGRPYRTEDRASENGRLCVCLPLFPNRVTTRRSRSNQQVDIDHFKKYGALGAFPILIPSVFSVPSVVGIYPTKIAQCFRFGSSVPSI